MANLAQFDLAAKGQEARTRALLEDLVEYHIGGQPPHFPLAVAVWYGKSLKNQDQNVLELFGGLQREGIEDLPPLSLLWKSGSARPLVNIRATSVDYFSKLMREWPDQIAPYLSNYDVLYFDKKLLTQNILDAFKIVTDPPGLMKGWYVSEHEYSKSKNIRDLLSLYGHTRPNFGLVKTGESLDFENCRGVLHVEISQKWLPISPEDIRAYTYYNDQQNDRPVYFLFEGGSLYRVLKFEVKTVPEYAGKLLEKTRDDRYPEVYLRAMHPSAQPAA